MNISYRTEFWCYIFIVFILAVTRYLSPKTLPNANNLRDQYLDRVFETHLNYIKSNIEDQKISLIVDESPDLLDRKTVNTLISFFNKKENAKKVLLVDVSFLKSVNYITIKNNILKVLPIIGKEMKDVLCISSDSAPYMKKAVQELAAIHDNIFQVNDVAHLIHNCVNEGLKLSDFNTTKVLLIKFGTLFQHSSL